LTASTSTTIPNTTARLLIPASDQRTYTIHDKPLSTSPLAKQLATADTARAYQLDAGSYIIDVQAHAPNVQSGSAGNK
jgi:hypothetical protein